MILSSKLSLRVQFGQQSTFDLGDKGILLGIEPHTTSGKGVAGREIELRGTVSLRGQTH